jgi:hypothetical protein
MSRKPRVDRSREEKSQIVQEGIKSGNVSETCRTYAIAPTLSIAERIKPSGVTRHRLGGEAPRRWIPRRTAASGNKGRRRAEVAEGRNYKKCRGNEPTKLNLVVYCLCF